MKEPSLVKHRIRKSRASLILIKIVTEKHSIGTPQSREDIGGAGKPCRRLVSMII